jgi:membrane-bound ClpP family serine protease
MKKILKIIKKNRVNLILVLISIVAFITGILAIGWIKSLIVVGIIDFLLFGLPVILDKRKKGKAIATIVLSILSLIIIMFQFLAY